MGGCTKVWGKGKIRTILEKFFLIAKFHKLFLFVKTELETVQWLVQDDVCA